MGGDDAHDPTLSNMPQHILNQIGKGVRAPVKAIDPALAESTLSKSKSFLASVKTAGAAEAVVRVAPRTRYEPLAFCVLLYGAASARFTG